MAQFNNQYSPYSRAADRRPAAGTSTMIWFAVLVLEIFIAFRIFLKAIGANPQAGFANLVYGLTGPFLAPFSGLINNPSTSNHVLEITSIIAMLAYVVLFWLAILFLRVWWNR